MEKKDEPVGAGSENLNYKAIVTNFCDSAIGFEQQNAVKSTSAGLGGSPREPYLTNTDNSPPTLSSTPVIDVAENEPDFTENSMKMYVDTMNLYRTNKNVLQLQHLHGFQRLKYVNDSNLILYRPSNPAGNSNAGWKLAAENSDTDKARLASKQRALEKLQANIDVWKYFATFTLDATKQDRFNFEVSSARVLKFLQRRGIKYVLVPERHKDNKAWHFHAVLSADISPYLADFEGKALRAKKIRESIAKGEHPQHCKAYTKHFGYNFVVPIRNQEACCFYVAKYVTKTFDDPNFERVSRRRYFASTGLKEPYVVLPRYVDLDDYELSHVSRHTEKVYLKRFNFTHSTATPPPAFTPPPLSSLKG